MSTALPGRPIQNEAPNLAERFQTSILLVLGLTLIGAAGIALGFAGGSAHGVAIGAGVVLAAGAISVFSATAGSRFRFENIFAREVDSRRANHVPLPAEPSVLSRDVEAAETSPHHEGVPVRPRELFPDLRRYPFVKPN
jgi:hypothetical protein